MATKKTAVKKAAVKKAAVKKAAVKKATAANAPAAKAKPSLEWKAPKEVKLLSGGNPQIPKGDGEAPVAAYIAAMPEWKRDIGERIDALVVRAVPRVKKAVRWNTPFYGVEGKGWFLGYHCFNKYIKVTLLNGDHLTPLPPIEAAQGDARYFHIFEGDDFEAQLSTWVKQAAKLPGDMLF